MALVPAEAFMGMVIAALRYTFVYRDSELAFGEDGDRLVTYMTILVAPVGVVFSVVGFLIAVMARTSRNQRSIGDWRPVWVHLRIFSTGEG